MITALSAALSAAFVTFVLWAKTGMMSRTY